MTAPPGQPDVSLAQRLTGHVVGNDELSAEDHAKLAPALPVTAHVTAQPPAAAPKQVNFVWDVSTPDGSLAVINLPNGLELLDGGCIVARATPLHFTCSSLTRTGGPPAGYSGDFNILGRPGAPVATPGAPPAPGQAPAGAPGQCTSAGIAGQGGGSGAAGQQGTTGIAGLPGHDGIASALATITITGSLTLKGAKTPLLVMATQSGPGGTGGNWRPGRHRTAGRQRRQRRDLRLHRQRRRRRRTRWQGRYRRPGGQRRERRGRRRQHRRVRAQDRQHGT